MRRAVHTSIPSERRALVALVVILAAFAALFIVTVGIGDQRRLTVVLATPGQGEVAPVTLREISITFNADANTDSIDSRLDIEPPAAGAVRWRGRTLVYTFASALRPGPYHVTIAAGGRGRGSQPMTAAYALDFTVREPAVAAIVSEGGLQQLVAVRDGVSESLYSAAAISDFAIAPDGSGIALLTRDQGGTSSLVLINTDGSDPQTLSSDPAISLGGLTWSSDGGALLVVRRDALPGGGLGVPHVWLMRRSGEWVGAVDEGTPSISPSWSPDAQSIAYIAPADGRLTVLNLTTKATVNLGQPRGGATVWSPDSRVIAYETVPPDGATELLQQVRLQPVDGAAGINLGVADEVRSSPAFLDTRTIMTLRRVVGPDSHGTDLLFESTSDGSLLRSILIAGPQDVVTNWQLDPSGRRVVYAVRSGAHLTILVLELESGAKTALKVSGTDPRWLP